MLFLKYPLIFKFLRPERQLLSLHGQLGCDIALPLPDIADFHIHTGRFLKKYLFERGTLVVMDHDGSVLILAGIQHPLDHVTVGKMGVSHIERTAFHLGLGLSFDVYPLGEPELTADKLVTVLLHIDQRGSGKIADL